MAARIRITVAINDQDNGDVIAITSNHLHTPEGRRPVDECISLEMAALLEMLYASGGLCHPLGGRQNASNAFAELLSEHDEE